MNKVEVRDKLWKIIRQMLLSDLESNHDVPSGISDYILENHGWAIADKADPHDDLHDFVKDLQKWIEATRHTNKDHVEELEYEFGSVFERYLQAEMEYSEVIADLVQALGEIILEKEKYSNYFKNKCRVQEGSMDVLNSKSQFLKLQFLLKLYGEENALNSHLILQKKLKEELEILKQTHQEQLERNRQYDEMKDDKKFCELFKIYKDLRKREKWTEIIGEL